MPNGESKFQLPAPPEPLRGQPVRAWSEPVVIDTYHPLPPSRFPAYLDRRVYQGSSGAVYPLPFYERIEQAKRPHSWQALHIENDYLRLMVLPELGGRIQVGMDRTNGYDFFYRNNVIKPALVGLAGPWLSGGVEFNWPQHHRPSTFLPTESWIETAADGSRTLWCSELDPFARMREAHGVTVRPGSSLIELKVRLVNRTEDVQTFLWWANAAAAVGDGYQCFFPTDVHYVADHARRDIVSFPRPRGTYYGVDYPRRSTPDRPDGDRLDWYRNIPVPTSYMCLGSEDAFFGGYDHGARAGFVHWAEPGIAPGKKLWTWGNSAFGWAWDRNLTDNDGPYVELMAGVFTDNQPDFSFLLPGEQRSFSQFWYPLREIGPVHQATPLAAVRLDIGQDRARVGLVTTSPVPATVRLTVRDQVCWDETVPVGPEAPLVREVPLPVGGVDPAEVEVVAYDQAKELVRWRPRTLPERIDLPDPADEPAPPGEVPTSDELYFTGLHLEQYRHATRSPEPYWVESLRRDPLDYRVNVAMAARRYRNGQFGEAEGHLRAALSRATRRNPNPVDGEAHYRLGLVHRAQGLDAAAYAAFGKAAWNGAWSLPAWLAMARMDLRLGRVAEALELTARLVRQRPQHRQGLALRLVALRAAGADDEAKGLAASLRRLDPLDPWLRHLTTGELLGGAATAVDIALDYRSCGRWQPALDVLGLAEQQEAGHPVEGAGNQRPLIAYHRWDLLVAAGRTDEAAAELAWANALDRDHCFPGRLEDALMLERVLTREPAAENAAVMLAHWLYAHGRPLEAMARWETAPRDAVSRRNLGLAAYNVLHDPVRAREHYDSAMALAPADPKLLYERDQLARRLGESPEDRLADLERRLDLVSQRDDLTIEYANLLTLCGRPEEAVQVMVERRFQPWEGGEGMALGAWEQAQSALARRALRRGDPGSAVGHLEAALDPPDSLGEGRHFLASTADLHLLLGNALAASGRPQEAERAWLAAAGAEGDFVGMSTAEFSEKSYSVIEALKRLGRVADAETLARRLRDHATELARTPAGIDYFATSLPSLLLFHEDLACRQEADSLVLGAQAALALGDPAEAVRLARRAEAADAGHTGLAQLQDALLDVEEVGR